MTTTTAPREVLLGVTGSISAYKACDLVEALKAARFAVTAVMTDEALHFLQPLSLQVLTGRRVYTSLFETLPEDGAVHITLAHRAQTVLIAPATANIIGKLACGIADDLLTCIVLASRAPLLLAPAMNVQMYEHPAVQANLVRLKTAGATCIEPLWGTLACGDEGMGHLADLSTIVQAVQRVMS